MSRRRNKRKLQIVDDRDLRFVVYKRKSTEDKKHQIYSIEDQGATVHGIAKQNEYQIVAEFEEERSAAKPYNRPEFDKMMNMIKSGKANAILCCYVDRLSRNPIDSAVLQWDLSQGIIQKIHAVDGIFRPREGNLALALQNSLATQYSLNLSGNVGDRMDKNNRRGRWNGYAPTGYINGRDDENPRKSVIKRDDKKIPGTNYTRYELVHKALKMFGTGKYSPVEIKQALDSWGYLTRRGKQINLGGVHHILESPFYCGYVVDPEDESVWHKAEWEPMISEEEYRLNQEIKQQYSRNGKKPRVAVRAKRFELKGIMTCSSCGCGIGGGYHPKRMADGSVKVYTHYACNNNKHNTHRICQLHGGISEPEAFAQIEALLDQYRISQPLYDWALEILQNLKDEEIKERYEIEKSQNATIGTLKARRERLLDQWLEHEEQGVKMTLEDYNTRREKLDNAIAELEQSRTDMLERNKNWFEIIGKTLHMLADHHKMLTEGVVEGIHRDIIQAIGSHAYLVEGFDRYSKTGKVLTKRVIKIDPYPWLEKLKKSAEKMEQDYGQVFTTNLQGENCQKLAPYSKWSG